MPWLGRFCETGRMLRSVTMIGDMERLHLVPPVAAINGRQSLKWDESR